MPGDLLFVYEERGQVRGLARAEHDGVRDEWTIVELDAIDDGTAGDIRFRLVQHLLRDASKRGAVRFHVACADEGGNVELFMQAGFARYGEERLLYRPPDQAARLHSVTAEARRGAGIRPGGPARRAGARPPVPRLDARAGGAPRGLPPARLGAPGQPLARAALGADADPPLRRRRGVRAGGAPEEADASCSAFCQIGVAKAEQPHYIRVISRPDHDPSDLIAFGLSAIAERTRSRWSDLTARWQRAAPTEERGIVSAVRTYEAPIDRRLEDQGFGDVATVSLLMKELAERVTEPALVPAVLR